METPQTTTTIRKMAGHWQESVRSGTSVRRGQLSLWSAVLVPLLTLTGFVLSSRTFLCSLFHAFFLLHFELCLYVIGDRTYICWVSSHGELMTRAIHLYHIYMIAFTK